MRVNQSAELIKTLFSGEGMAWPLANATMRECSRNLPTMLLTRMREERPGTPGRSAHMPRTTADTFTPASLARYSSLMRPVSTRLLHLTSTCAGSPARALAISASMSASSELRKLKGATASTSSSCRLAVE